jgi:uncharacterized protein
MRGQAPEGTPAEMKIRIRDVVSSGIRLEYLVKPEEIDVAGEEFIEPENPIKVIADLTKVNNFVLGKLAVTFIRENYCARCLEHISHEATSHYEVELEIIDGDEWLDLGAKVREEMLVEHFPRTLCREDCKGICPDCGTDLNSEQCKCNKGSK